MPAWVLKSKNLILQSKPLIFGVTIAILLIYSGLSLILKSQTSNHIQNSTNLIVLTSDGFSPSEISIKKGTTVTFTTNSNQPFWPASDLHPSHLLYPEFDPRKPIQPDKSWTFTFDKVGTWPFHDHLFPAYRGRVVVNP